MLEGILLCLKLKWIIFGFREVDYVWKNSWLITFQDNKYNFLMVFANVYGTNNTEIVII